MSRNFKKNGNCLQIRWRMRKYYFDIFTPEFFLKDAEEEQREHGMFYEDGDDAIPLSCVATIKGDFARLTYRDQPEDIDEGHVIIYFSSIERNEVTRIDWEALDGKISIDQATSNWDSPSDVKEGEERTREAKYVFRNKEIVSKRKQIDKNTCQACGYELAVEGVNIIDVHHINPISSNKGSRITSIYDLVCLCPNCHRIAHTSNPPLDVPQIKALLTNSCGRRA